MTLEIFLLGQFKLIALPSRPAQSLLAYLALNAGAALRREKLASTMWGEATDANARAYLRQALWRIRKSVEHSGLLSHEFIDITEISVTFKQNSDYWLDVDHLVKPVENRAVNLIVEEIRLYRGELLPGFYEEWISLERDRIQAAYFQKMNFLIDRLSDLRLWDEVIQWGEHWIHHTGFFTSVEGR